MRPTLLGILVNLGLSAAKTSAGFVGHSFALVRPKCHGSEAEVETRRPVLPSVAYSMTPFQLLSTRDLHKCRYEMRRPKRGHLYQSRAR
jgi:hypothetical protein